jgi:hypothetical protein
MIEALFAQQLSIIRLSVYPFIRSFGVSCGFDLCGSAA